MTDFCDYCDVDIVEPDQPLLTPRGEKLCAGCFGEDSEEGQDHDVG